MSKKTRRTKPKTNVTKQKSTRKIMSGGNTLAATTTTTTTTEPPATTTTEPPGANADAKPDANADANSVEKSDANSVENSDAPPEKHVSTATTADKCLEYPSLLSTVPPECTVPGPQPQFHDLMEAAIRAPVDEAIKGATELAGDTLKSTGNAALVDIATKKALGIEDAELLNKLSEDPKVAAELAKFQNNMSKVVEKSIDNLGDKIQKPVEEAAEQLATGVITTGTSALASVTGPLVPLATIAGTAGQLVNEATEITGAVKDAQKEVGQAMSQVTDVQKALDEAAKNAIPEVKVPEMPKVEVPKVEMPKVEVPKVEVPEVPEVPKVAPAAGGGSRKRRRIQKLSRRIERTLRRVQKKYGLRDDKNSFLRRTLRSNKP